MHGQFISEFGRRVESYTLRRAFFSLSFFLPVMGAAMPLSGGDIGRVFKAIRKLRIVSESTGWPDLDKIRVIRRRYYISSLVSSPI